MGWFVALGMLTLAMVFSEKFLGNPVSFLGLILLGFCVYLLIGVVVAGIGA